MCGSCHMTVSFLPPAYPSIVPRYSAPTIRANEAFCIPFARHIGG